MTLEFMYLENANAFIKRQEERKDYYRTACFDLDALIRHASWRTEDPVMQDIAVRAQEIMKQLEKDVFGTFEEEAA